jgi:tRNA dimethylallyltransferase
VSLADAPAKPELRGKLAKKNVAELFSMLQSKDPSRANKMNASERNNPVRIIRALEVARSKPAKRAPVHIDEALWIGIQPDKKTLRKKIHDRLHARMNMGMVAEAKRLHANGLSWKRMESLGLEYRYLAFYLQNKISKAEMLKELEVKIWQYAKRQMTYWRRNKDIRWFESADKAESWLKKNF